MVDFFNDAMRKVRFSDPSHFQWLIAIENDGTSLYRLTDCRKTEFFNSLWTMLNEKWWARQDSNLGPRDSLEPFISEWSGLSHHPQPDC